MLFLEHNLVFVFISLIHSSDKLLCCLLKNEVLSFDVGQPGVNFRYIDSSRTRLFIANCNSRERHFLSFLCSYFVVLQQKIYFPLFLLQFTYLPLSGLALLFRYHSFLSFFLGYYFNYGMFRGNNLFIILFTLIQRPFR
jgi:hypothetical protein